MYKVVLDKKALKAFEKLPKHVVKGFRDKFEKLAHDPYVMAGVDTIKSPKSIGLPVEIAYRIRVTDYRAIYTIMDDIITIVVLDIEHRSEAYKKK